MATSSPTAFILFCFRNVTCSTRTNFPGLTGAGYPGTPAVQVNSDPSGMAHSA